MKAEKTAQSIFSQRAAFYTDSPAHTDKEVLQRLIEHCQPQKTDAALDIATGTGHTAFALAPHVASVSGIDVTEEMLAEAQKLQQLNGLTNVSFQLGDAESLPFTDASFDIVTARRAPHHFTAIRKAISEMRRVLKPNGRLVIDDRSVPENEVADALMNKLDKLHDPSHVREYRPSEWSAMLTDAGFQMEALEFYTRHRPLTALTENAFPDDAVKIERIAASLSDDEKAAINMDEVDGKVHHDHFFVMLAAVKA